MNKIKAVLRWIKENIWIPLSAAVVLLLSILLLRKPNNRVLEAFSKNRELQEAEKNVINQANEKVQQETQKVSRQVKEKVKKVKAERIKRGKKIKDDSKVLLDELSKRTNEELAEMLKKDDEV
jgi:uncharacterized membrane protein YhiD involved in acid resistance